ncbi:integrase [Calothrix sp. HK-06]|nr:integrase [Calothrix sp. HK-06]OKH47340.1 integrase [Calothrix sp. HK-06]
MSLEEQIKAANARLKAANAAITIEQDGSKLRLRGTFPLRSGEGRKQQRIPLSISASSEGLKQAEFEAYSVRRALDSNSFSWDKYLNSSEPSRTKVSDWVEAFEKDYFEKRDLTPKSQTTWKTDYLHVFKKLPVNQPLTSGLIRKTVLSTKPDTKSRKRYCICLGALAKFAGLDITLTSLAGKYNPKSVSPRNIPDDFVIAEQYYKIKNESWRWVYGLLATYGLRNHEVFRIDFDQLRSGNPILHILEGKTGARRVWAIYPEWFTEFKLSSVNLPNVDTSSERKNSALGAAVTRRFQRDKIGFAPYNLRHAWAIRSLEFGLDISLAAQQMGHSLTVHSELYHHWISDKHHQRAYEALMLRDNRPVAPRLDTLTKP